jgi:Cof subfamily protein (haloacid dehalogenase superfamily)
MARLPEVDSARERATARPAEAIRMVAVDVDGTLLRSDKQLTRRTAEAIRRACEAGVKVVLASARPPRSLRAIQEALRLDTPQVNYNGALVHDMVRRRHLSHRPLEVDLARRVIQAARRADRDCVVSIEILDRWYTDRLDETLPTETSKSFAPDFVGPLDAFLTVPVTKLMLLAPEARMGRIRAAVEKRFIGQVGLAVSDRYLLQVLHREATKAAALQGIADQFGIARDQVMAIGDAPNDVPMLRWAGFGVAVANAWSTALAAADAVVGSNDEDGVAQAIERYVLEG